MHIAVCVMAPSGGALGDSREGLESRVAAGSPGYVELAAAVSRRLREDPPSHQVSMMLA